jgi:hypothetical protein
LTLTTSYSGALASSSKKSIFVEDGSSQGIAQIVQRQQPVEGCLKIFERCPRNAEGITRALCAMSSLIGSPDYAGTASTGAGVRVLVRFVAGRDLTKRLSIASAHAATPLFWNARSADRDHRGRSTTVAGSF